MPVFLETWPPQHVLMLVFIVACATFLIVLILAILRYNMRALTDATALQRERLNADVTLKRELIQRGLPPQELEQTIKLLKLDEPPAAAPSRNNVGKTDQQIEAELIAQLAVQDGVSAEDLEQAIGLVRVADRPTKEAALDLVGELTGSAEADVVLAAVGSLCRPSDRPREDGKASEIAERITR